MKTTIQTLITITLLLVTTPLSAQSGVTLFQHCGYTGYQATLRPGAYTLADLNALGLRNDDLSSIQVPRGFQAVVFEHDHFSGQSIVYGNDRNCFVDDRFNDVISSVIVARHHSARHRRPEPGAKVFQHCDYGGYTAELPPGNYTLSDLRRLGVRNDDISSIRVPRGYEITLYEHDYYAGRYWTITADNRCFVDQGFNDIVSSISVRCGHCR